MTKLQDQQCEACVAGAPVVSQAESKQLLTQIPEWQIKEVTGVPRLWRCYPFKNFAEALAFTNRVGELAEAQKHHPELITEWGKVTVSWWTHKIKGLHRNDFIMASKTDAVAQR